MIDQRRHALSQWVAEQVHIPAQELEMVSGDASFRRYFRLPASGQRPSRIAVDCPPEKEPLDEFLTVSAILNGCGLQVPQIIAFDKSLGFMLISDLGDRLYLPELNEQTADALYQPAIQALVQMQLCPGETIASLPNYDRPRLRQEMELFRQWFLGEHLQMQLSAEEHALLDQTFSQLEDSALLQTQRLVHRDYHSRNLMIGTSGTVGIIDYQDAVTGPVTYDLVSLFKDCYIAWPRTRQLQWLQDYYQQAVAQQLPLPEFNQFVADYDRMGLQRHIKVAGIFCRLFHRDGKSGYLKDIPLTLGYIQQALQLLPEFSDFYQWFSQRLIPVLAAVDLTPRPLS